MGKGDGGCPAVPEFHADKGSDLTVNVHVHADNATGYNILWGTEEDKLYHSCLTFDTHLRLGAFVKGETIMVIVAQLSRQKSKIFIMN